jgi:hypothetical protein
MDFLMYACAVTIVTRLSCLSAFTMVGHGFPDWLALWDPVRGTRLASLTGKFSPCAHAPAHLGISRAAYLDLL